MDNILNDFGELERYREANENISSSVSEGSRVVFSSVLPVHNYNKISHKCIYLDYFSSMVDGEGLLKKNLSDDGLHLSRKVYAVMTPLAGAAIQEALESHT